MSSRRSSLRLLAFGLTLALGLHVPLRASAAQTAAWRLLPPPANVGLHVHDSRRDREIFLDASGLSVMPDSASVVGERIWWGSNPSFGEPGFAFYEPAQDRLWLIPPTLHDTLTVWWMDLSWTPLEWQAVQCTSNLGDTLILYPGFGLDPVRDRLVTFGGGAYAGVAWLGTTNAVYTMSLGATPHIARAAVGGSGPGPRMSAAMVHDPWRDRMIEYGGRGSGYYDDAWAFTLAAPMTWQSLAPTAIPPSARVPGATALDSLGRRWFIQGSYVLGGTNYGGDTWSLDLSASVPAGAAAWTQVGSVGGSDPERFGALIPQPRFGRMLAYDGWDTWALSLGATPALSRFASGALGGMRRSLGVAFVDPDSELIYAGLGIDGAWQCRPLGANAPWLTLSTTGPSAPRFGAACAVDPVGRRAYVFGGSDTYYTTQPGGANNELWVFDLDAHTWTQLHPSNPPIVRTRAVAVFDTDNRKLVIHGGYYQNPTLVPRWDTWLYDVASNTWTEALPGSYGAYWGEAAVYDPVGRRLVTFGGENTLGAAPTDVHVLPLSPTVGEWAVLPTTGTMPTWSLPYQDDDIDALAATYDAPRHRMIVMAGSGTKESMWSLALGDTGAWAPIALLGSAPDLQYGSVLVSDPVRDRVLRVGGISSFGSSNPTGDTWALEFDSTTPTLLALASCDASPEQVSLRWYDGSSEATVATVYRGADGGDEWVALGRAGKDASGVIAWTDRDVVAGAAYDYRLGVVGPSGEAYFGQTHVVVPATNALALAGARPNPSHGPVYAVFSLANSRPAKLELLDVAGRRVLGREVGSLGPGAHQLRIDAAGTRPPSGLYFLRLTQDGRARSAKVIIAR